MRNKFDSQLEKLNLELITMGALCEDAISASVKGFLDDDDALCQKAVETEDEINRKERDIESICMKLLLEQQPVARDLRVISSALKMISDMERIGDPRHMILPKLRNSLKTVMLKVKSILRIWLPPPPKWSPTALTPLLKRMWN